MIRFPKRIVLLTVGVAWLMTGCEPPREITMAEIDQYQDSILSWHPGVSAQVTVEERVHLRLIAGGSSLYNAPEDTKQQVAARAGRLALSIFGKDIRDGVLVLTNKIQNHTDMPDDGITVDMKIGDLKKAQEQQ